MSTSTIARPASDGGPPPTLFAAYVARLRSPTTRVRTAIGTAAAVAVVSGLAYLFSRRSDGRYAAGFRDGQAARTREPEEAP